ncbi:MAG TPA: GntR family transcriptional regulator [Candidatus Dormibacteraeota bacterium]|nr:GntR family transcriptional regulator [Candidatus Dormibacteraeota bacterium]
MAGGVSTARPIRSRTSSAPELRTVVLHSKSARSQGERAYLLIRDQIVTLKLAPGSVIEEAGLRQELGLGRTPIREALQRLAHENLVSFIPHRGTFVCDINLTDLHRLTEVRVEMEGYAARLAAERAGANDRAAMEALMAELETIDESDVRGLMRLDQQIHRQVYQVTRNAFLQAMLEESFNLSLRIWFLGLDRGVRLKEAVEEHRQLLDAIVSRDPKKAESVMRQHVAGFEHAIRKVL